MLKRPLAWLPPGLAVLLIAGTAPALAQVKAEPSQWPLSQQGVKLHPDEVPDLHTSEPKPLDPYEFRRGIFSSMGLYEYKPIGAVEGAYTRPHYTFGISSDLMRSALSLTGLEADRCIAPMVRMRARQTTITGTNGVSLTVFARCTFN